MGIIRKIVTAIVIQLISTGLSLCITFTIFLKWLRHGNKLFEVKDRSTPPEILNDAKYGTHSYITLKKQGIKLHYVHKGDESKPLMLCLHGFPEFWFSWRHQLEEFSDSFWVVAVDLRGYGNSDKPKGIKAYNRWTIAEDVAELIKELGREKCTLVAHDWGGAIAWIVANKYPQMVERHISMNGPHPTAFMRHIRSSWTQKMKSWYMIYFRTPWLPEFMFRLSDMELLEVTFRGKNKNKEAFPDEVIEAYKYNYNKKDAFTCPLNYYRATDYSEKSSGDCKICVPTLIIWGTEDTALDKELAKLATKYCEDVQLKFVDGATHWVQQEEPVYVNKLIREYIQLT